MKSLIWWLGMSLYYAFNGKLYFSIRKDAEDIGKNLSRVEKWTIMLFGWPIIGAYFLVKELIGFIRELRDARHMTKFSSRMEAYEELLRQYTPGSPFITVNVKLGRRWWRRS